MFFPRRKHCHERVAEILIMKLLYRESWRENPLLGNRCFRSISFYYSALRFWMLIDSHSKLSPFYRWSGHSVRHQPVQCRRRNHRRVQDRQAQVFRPLSGRREVLLLCDVTGQHCLPPFTPHERFIVKSFARHNRGLLWRALMVASLLRKGT